MAKQAKKQQRKHEIFDAPLNQKRHFTGAQVPHLCNAAQEELFLLYIQLSPVQMAYHRSSSPIRSYLILSASILPTLIFISERSK